MVTKAKYKVGILATHPVQYYAPWYRALASQSELNLDVYYCYNLAPQEQGQAGFNVAFEWDIPLLEGYQYQFLNNQASNPSVFNFTGCDTPEIATMIKQNKFDAFIVHGWYNKSYWQAIIACWTAGTPVIVRGDSHLATPRSNLKKLTKWLFYRLFIPRFAAYLAVGELARNYYLHYGADPHKIYFAPHAVNNTFFAEHQARLGIKRKQLRKDRQIPGDAVVCLFVGKIYPGKRLRDFLDAIGAASQRNCQIFGVVVGDGPQRHELEEYAKVNTIAVKFLGFFNQTEMPIAYTISDILIVPSESETWGLVVNEAMASGLPAIVSDRVGCAPDLVQPDVTGQIFSCGDTKRLAEILVQLATNPTQLQQMAKNAAAHVKHYSIECAVQGTVQAIRDIAKLRG